MSKQIIGYFKEYISYNIKSISYFLSRIQVNIAEIVRKFAERLRARNLTMNFIQFIFHLRSVVFQQKAVFQGAPKNHN